ncbi:caspase family protein [Candidatus Thiodictyon syntrophicum]|jgi:hypothetical protein|uniref:Caspase family p20 domain-containing protein n=1 Tax=Candidatus Thiodictyon syntrophicum TaxID=1166950 RepID=A0A2K8U776_9GAMM|nr:caspase family protein [Candidatus Thiodictyon syntrophicum]AUB81423.1 hypothetical protein THSYN_10975 [Candidatus Thiodictyon syntrophicum]
MGSENVSSSIFYASQSGRPTLDQGEGRGNPFATSLIELLARPSLKYSELRTDIVSLTQHKSRGFQVPDVPAVETDWTPAAWQLKPAASEEKRMAFIFVYSDYEKAGVSSLPGAERDLGRVTDALVQAGFAVETAANPTKQELQRALADFSRRSASADAATIYVTGHGFEQNGKVYLAPNDYPFKQGAKVLSEMGIDIVGLGNYLKAKSANMVFYGGCRSELR